MEPPVDPQFVPGDGPYRRSVVLHGASNMAGLANKTTFDVSITDGAGRVIVSETYVYTVSARRRAG